MMRYIKSLFSKLLESQISEYKVYSDMDGVMTDYFRAVKEMKSNTEKKEYGELRPSMSREEYYEMIQSEGIEFWENMPWMADGKKYWNYIKSYNPIILTTPASFEESRQGKFNWIRRELGIKENQYFKSPKKYKQAGYKPRIIISGSKEQYIDPSFKCILIDDAEKNITKWKDNGGIGILHTSATDTIKQLKELGL